MLFKLINLIIVIDGDKIPSTPKVLTPSMVKLPPSAEPNPTLRPNKSANDLIKQKNLPANLSNSSQDVSRDPRGPSSSTNRNTTIVVDEKTKPINKKEQAKLEKKRLAEQKAREKAEAQERAKQEKLRKQREKQAAREQAKDRERQAAREKERQKRAAKEQGKPKRDKNTAPAPPPLPPQSNPVAANPAQSYSTNTMLSSISTSSGPPPYADVPKPKETSNSNSGNVTFSKPIKEETNSWDLISQHREQMSRPVAQDRPRAAKNMVMDLQYTLGDDKSEA
jgi:hypothetical protein